MSDGSITRNQFANLVQNSSVDADTLAKDARLDGVDVRSADLDRDGRISGQNEARALFREIDKLERGSDRDSVRTLRPDGTATRAASAMAAVGDAAGVAALKRPLEQARNRIRSNDRVVLLGLNPGGSAEAAGLQRQGVPVTNIGDIVPGDTIRVGGQTYDLTDRAQALAFAHTLRLSPAQTQAVADAIHGANEDTKDELAQLARVWAQAERGESMPSRFVLSGHSVGGGEWWGDDNGILLRQSVGELADAMPRAARQVEDLHLAGCYGGGRRDVDQWRAIFPNVKTVWAYSESAPGSHSGAQTHLARWAGATRGSVKNLGRDVARGTRKGDNVAVWSIDGGYDDGNPPVPIAALRAMVTRGGPTFQSYFDGSIVVSSTQHGALRDYYNHVQALVQRPDLGPGQERDRMESRRDQTIRLIYYNKTVAKNFADHYASRIEAGFRAVGMPVPDFAQLGRADALRAIERFEQAVADASAAPEAARELVPLLTKGLRDLDKTVIPHNWI